VIEVDHRAPGLDDHAAHNLVIGVAWGATQGDEIAARLHVVPVSSSVDLHLEPVEADPEAGR